VTPVRLSPVLAGQETYPFVRLEEAKRRTAARGVQIFDFGVGDPREATDPRIQQALVDALPLTSGYPAAVGLPELRKAVAAWIGRRFGVEVDPERELIPTLGSKEAIFSFAQVIVNDESGRDTILIPEPCYPVYERGAQFARARIETIPLRAGQRFLPDLDGVDRDTWSRTAVLWVNYPNNPTGATAPLSFYERLAELAAEHDFLVASDEAYTELWFDEPPASALQVSDRGRFAVFNTLSKRSSMTGYRSGFVAASAEVVDALRKFRPSVGTAPQDFVQRASAVAWSDEEHVERNRELYRRKREVVLRAFERGGCRLAGGNATMYLWLECPDGEASEAFAGRLLEQGIVVAPGSFFGAHGEGYARVALVPTLEECEEAARVLGEAL
jgi:succinyldiaminopimelate transaminase